MTPIRNTSIEGNTKTLILYLTEKSERDPGFSSTKINHLPFHCDFAAYRQLGRLITGYLKLPSGPATKAVRRTCDCPALSTEEFQIIGQVIEDLWQRSVDELRNSL